MKAQSSTWLAIPIIMSGRLHKYHWTVDSTGRTIVKFGNKVLGDEVTKYPEQCIISYIRQNIFPRS
jgi:hypothetical protein